jgi:hypothetical protein
LRREWRIPRARGGQPDASLEKRKISAAPLPRGEALGIWTGAMISDPRPPPGRAVAMVLPRRALYPSTHRGAIATVFPRAVPTRGLCGDRSSPRSMFKSYTCLAAMLGREARETEDCALAERVRFTCERSAPKGQGAQPRAKREKG